MERYGVLIPGTEPGLHTVYAESEADAIAEALRSAGLTFAPPGTAAAPVSRLRSHELEGIAKSIGRREP